MTYLDELVQKYNQPEFIENDPISIPHRFSKLQDIEIAGFWVSMLGQLVDRRLRARAARRELRASRVQREVRVVYVGLGAWVCARGFVCARVCS